MTTPDTPGRLARGTAALVGGVGRVPWLVLALCGVSVVAAVWLSATQMRYQTQRNDLISAEKECQKRWQKYLDAFGDDDDLVVVVRGTDRRRMTAAADAVADRLQRQPKLFDRVFHQVDLRSLHGRSLFFLPPDQLQTIQRRLDGMDPLLGRFSSIGWQTLSLQALLTQAKFSRDAVKPTQADRDLMATLPAVVDSAARTLENPADYRNPWSVAGSRDQAEQLREPQHFFTPDGRLALVLARPVKESESFTPVKQACEAARSILADVRQDFPELDLGLTGLPVLETDEMAASDEDSTSASWLALLGVAVLYLVVYRGFRYPLLTVGTLLIGSAWALGWATLTVGHLNILSTTFAVMIIGMGDYGVLWVARYDEERRYGRDVLDALRETAVHAGPGILTAALTTSLAFFATMLADFKAVAELGWIAGCGVLLCAAACFTFLPATLVLVERRNRNAGAEAPIIPIATGRPFLPLLSSRPKLVLALGGVAVAVCAAFGGAVKYDANLLNMQARGLDSVTWEQELIGHAAGATWDAMSVAATRDEALALKAKYEALPGVGRVVEAASLVPDGQADKVAHVAAIHARLVGLPETIPDPLASEPDVIRELLTNLRGPAVDRLSVALTAPGAADRLREFDRRLRLDLLADLHELRAVSHAEPIALDDLPENFRERYVGRHGEFLVRAFAAESLWEFDKLEAFTKAAATADPAATGKSFRTLEGLRQMKGGFERAGLLALLVIVAVLWLDLRSLRSLLLGLFPLAVGIVATLGVMGLAGVPLNPANLIALPLIVGVGVDNGVHVLHDYADRLPGRLYRLSAATGRGITVAALTTVLGFGTLTLARHRGMASLGLALALGVTFCMVAALVLLPAILRLADGVKLKRPVKVVRREREKVAA
ncbi:MMPL family transporter [Limnoglobus roseus]|uniref:Putative transport protein MmpL9 n=1 Tax=Limnoglobus roseus TaxID=2598579 RepID=A0A5C1A270_9BACT|nr:MMPL family transporter [Limnoglobus roseus]QEL13209.1 putative transport protein MmpL9 [Limnoglobus roseus]